MDCEYDCDWENTSPFIHTIDRLKEKLFLAEALIDKIYNDETGDFGFIKFMIDKYHKGELI